jgi:hypothetical protein
MGQYTPRYEFIDVKEVGVDGATASQYSLHIEIVEVVDSDGQPWDPVPGPDPWDDLVVVDKATWSDGNVYAVGETISGVSATYTGGTDQVVYRSRTQHRPAGSSSWINSPWNNHTNTPQVISFTIPAGEENGEVRFQTQARDNGVDPVDQVNSFASVKSIDPATWGSLSSTVGGSSYNNSTAPVVELVEDLRGMYEVDCTVSFSGTASDVSYKWEARNGVSMQVSSQSDSTTLTFNSSGAKTVTCTLNSPTVGESTSLIFNFFCA